jgi:Protein of unknown function (DUF2905)
MARILIVVGLAIAAFGALWPGLSRLGLGRLPGDFVIRHDNSTFYAPITTCLIVSVVLSLLFWIIGR